MTDLEWILKYLDAAVLKVFNFYYLGLQALHQNVSLGIPV